MFIYIMSFTNWSVEETEYLFYIFSLLTCTSTNFFNTSSRQKLMLTVVSVTLLQWLSPECLKSEIRLD